MPDAMRKFRWVRAAITAASGVTAFFLYAGALLVLVVQAVLELQSDKLDALISATEDMVVEGRSVIERLNEQHFTHCSDELLGTMRRELFFASRIKDIGFVRNNFVLCTTGRGKLSAPVEQSPPDFVTSSGYKFWSAASIILFEGEVTAPLLQKGLFDVVLDNHWLQQQYHARSNHWERVFLGPLSQVLSAYGDAGVFRHLEQSPGHAISLSATYSESCSELIPFCIGTETRYIDVIQRNPGAVVFLVLICLLICVASCRAAWLTVNRWLGTDQRIIRGLDKDAYFPLYQPVVDLESGEVVGCEVLARFEDAFGALPPDRFIPALAGADRGWAFTRVIMRRTLEELEARAELAEGFRVNINLFPSDVARNRLIAADIARALAASRFQITFELTEDEELDTAAARDCIVWLKQQGFALAVDDFGTGYSNLSKVRDLGCDMLKIDRHFVFDMDTGGFGGILVPLMQKIAEGMGMQVVAEGVENSAQAAMIREMGIRYAQGWMFGKPMTAVELEERVLSAR